MPNASTSAEVSADEPAGHSGGQTGLALRRQAEDALRHERDRAQAYLDTVQTMIVALDAEGRITTVNRKACQLLGWAEQELIGQFWFGFCLPQPDGVEKVYPLFQTLMAGEMEATEYFENPILTRSGELRQVSWHNALLRDDQGRIVGTLSSGDDITERLRTEKALRESAEQYRLAVNATNDGMWDNNLRDGTVRFNESYVAAFGTPSENEDPWLWWTDHIHPDDRDRTLSSFDAAVNGSVDVWKCEYRFRRIDGTWANTYDRAHIRRESTGKADYVIGALADITERKQAEEALIASEARYRRLFESAKDGILILDAETGMIVDVNPVLVELLGVSRDSFFGKKVWDLGFFKDIIANQNAFAELQREEYVRYRDKPLETWDGRRIDVEFVSNVYLVNDHKVIQCNVRDITERKRAEAEKVKLEAQLKQAQKMESIGRLAGGVAHDFNNMLGVILGHAELALAQVDPALSLHADLAEILKATMRSADLTRQLLAFARKQTVAPKVLDLNETVTGMLNMLHRLIGENVDVKWQPEADLWSVKVDPSQIDQILANLCVNARDAIPGVGTLTIETGNSTLDENYCGAHAGCVPGEYVRLAVSDNGCGMDAETVGHIFEPFFTTKGVGEGTGLGLATVYGIVKQNNGFINVCSEPHLGTTFTIYLPRHMGKAGQARPEGATRPAQRGQETILVVEDEPSTLTLVKRMLEQQGYTVLAASTPGEALRLAKGHTSEITLLVTDVVMPEMNGRVLAKNLLSLFPHLRCLFMSGYTADVIAHHGVLDEGVHFMQKPFSTDDLATKVRDALDAQD